MCIAQNHAPFFQSLSPTSFYLKLYPSYFYHSLNPAHWLLLISINPASSFLLLKPASHKQSKIQQSSTNLSNNLWIQLPSTKHWIHDTYNNIWIQHFMLFAQSSFLLSISIIIYQFMNPASFFFSLNPSSLYQRLNPLSTFYESFQSTSFYISLNPTFFYQSLIPTSFKRSLISVALYQFRNPLFTC